MSEYYRYYNSSGSSLSTTTLVNMCLKKGPMSFCMAVTVKDQKGCRYRENASYAEHCMCWRERIDGACDSIWAQHSLDNPNKKET